MKTVEEMLKESIRAEHDRVQAAMEAEQQRLQDVLVRESELESAVLAAEIGLQTLAVMGDENWTLPEAYLRKCVRYYLFESGFVDPRRPRSKDVEERAFHFVWNGLYAARKSDYQFRLAELCRADWEYTHLKGEKPKHDKLPSKRDLCALSKDEAERLRKVVRSEVFPPKYRREMQAWIGSTGMLKNVPWQVRKGSWSVMPDFHRVDSEDPAKGVIEQQRPGGDEQGL
jgi:hypothetical protein